MATTSKLVYRVTSLSEAGDDRVVVNLVQVNESADGTTNTTYTNPLTFNLTTTEAAAYFPGQIYDVALTKRATTA